MKVNSIKIVNACDISYWQGKIDAQKMYDAGIRVCIIRAGYGTTIDKNFVTYINQLIKVGIHVGVYWFIYASNTDKAKDNARKCMEVIAPYKDKITCGVWADWEYDSDKRAGYMTVTKRCNIVKAFLDALEQVGYEVGIYSNQDYIQSGKFTLELIKSYPLWFAKYLKNSGKYANTGKNNTPYLWQYTSSGNGALYGVSSSNIDLDYCYIDLEEKTQENVTDELEKDNSVVTASDNPYPRPTRDIFYKKNRAQMHGDDVKWVQWHLWRFGLLLTGGMPDASKIDGYFGSESSRAVEEAQKRLGIKVDGIVGKITLDTFEKV